MKKLRKPTRRQKMELRRQKLLPDNWFVERDDGQQMVIVSREKGQVRRLRWGA
ncbi:hypothetical protein J27TS7_10670 [Paenibacillus dendritiformis]|uniref:DUF6906 family protein n=1 Tax=Paenibacillus TaxID=44249 RepID=UPI0016030ED0|nr:MULTISPECIES: hypothetical protein [Paenibacillus]WII36845.1 hypothetical protein O0V01_24955 [Paenibacillus thiaminolyticus]GIO71553.1 hypothetical protein J27TS7_10670 [Paenibacillus dendritiformis]